MHARFTMHALAMAVFAFTALPIRGDAQSLHVVWKVTWKSGVNSIDRRLLTSPDGSEVIIAGDDGIVARSVRDAHVLFRRLDAKGPVAFAGDRLIAVGPGRTIVALNVRTGKMLWKSAALPSSNLSIGADADETIAVADDDFNATTVAMSSVDGSRRWVRLGKGAIAGGRDIVLLPSVVVDDFIGRGEPMYSDVAIIDRRNGTNVAELENSRYIGIYRDELWSRPRDQAGYEPPTYDRYKLPALTRLPSYDYAPAFPPMVSDQVTMIPTDRNVFVELDDFKSPNEYKDPYEERRLQALFRYDRNANPAPQVAAALKLRALLIDVVDERPLMLDTHAAILLSQTNSKDYRQQRIPLPSDHNWRRGFVLAKSSSEAYIAVRDWSPGTMVAITVDGRSSPVAAATCRGPRAVTMLPGGDAIALCEGALVRFRQL